MAIKLLLIRHAEAIEPNIALKDIDRPLTEHGANMASRLGSFLKEEKIYPDLFLCSSALRATDTANYIAEQLPYNASEIKVDEELYNISVGRLLNYIQGIDNQYKTVLIIGHNPALSYFIEYISNQTGIYLAPSNSVLLEFPEEDWSQVDKDKGKLLFFKKL